MPKTGRDSITAFLDDNGRIKAWPAKNSKKQAVLQYLSEKFETGRYYTEKEINAEIDRQHTFGDYFLLRRGMIEAGFLKRTLNCSAYWRPQLSEYDEKQPD